MKGKEIIQIIINNNGLDKEYDFRAMDGTETVPTQEIKADTLSDVCEVTVEYGEVVLRTETPLLARRFGLSDKYRKYVWDGHTMYVHKEDDEPSDWSISFGGGSETLVTDSVKKWRNAALREMVKQIAEKDIPHPEWLNWRITRHKEGRNVLSVFA